MVPNLDDLYQWFNLERPKIYLMNTCYPSIFGLKLDLWKSPNLIVIVSLVYQSNHNFNLVTFFFIKTTTSFGLDKISYFFYSLRTICQNTTKSS